MKKILHICMSQYSDGWTYQENLLAKYHKCLGYEVTMLTSMLCYKEGQLVNDNKTNFYDCNGIHVIRLAKEKKGFLGKLPVYKDFYSIIQKEKPDIVFSHGCQYRDTVHVAKYIKNNPDTLLYVDNHADFSNSATNFVSLQVLHKIVWKHYAHVLLPHVKKFWGVMPSRVEFLREVYGIPENKTGLLVMGADDEKVSFAEQPRVKQGIRKKYNIEPNDFLIVTGGKIDKAKLQTVLLMEAVASLKNESIKLLVFGSLEGEIRNRVLGLVDNKRVFYIGWISPDQSYEYFAAADLIAFPGRHSVFWEQAAGQGKPMICRDWDGTHHVDVGGNVIFIQNDSVTTICDILTKIYNDPEFYQKMKAVAENKASKQFSYMEIAKRSIGDNVESD